ncbi:MAG: metal-dependent transcriptional regulator [Gemmatimonadaceae bacterium]
MPHELTASVEDYLKAIYDLELSGPAATTTDIAQRLGVAPASVTGMARRLAQQGLIAHEPYRGITLTEAGRRVALRTLRRHRVLEAYLVHALHYSWDCVHVEAERLEHAVSDDLIDRMAESIGEPMVDPHGAPIPARDGTIDETRHPSLADIATGSRTRILRVKDEDPAMLQYLAELGLVPGADVVVAARAPFDGPITLKVGTTRRVVGPAVAAHVLVAQPE